MNETRAWKIVGANLPTLVGLMITVQKGAQVDVFCDPQGRDSSFSRPSAEANIKLCAVTAPDLEGSYGIRRKGTSFVTGDWAANSARRASRGCFPARRCGISEQGTRGVIEFYGLLTRC
jgi:hypothetical protein